jgi:hypothetical protein
MGDSLASKKSASGSTSSKIGRDGFGRSLGRFRVHILMRTQDPRSSRAEPTASRIITARLTEWAFEAVVWGLIVGDFGRLVSLAELDESLTSESNKMGEVTEGIGDCKGGRAENERSGVESGRDGRVVVGMMSPKVDVSLIAPSKGEPGAIGPKETGPVSGIGLGIVLISAGCLIGTFLFVTTTS